MSEYHKIETLYERDEKTHRLKPELILKNSVYGIIKTWHFTEKIDGTNIRLIWQPAIETDGPCRPESLRIGGKTDNAQIHADLIANIERMELRERFRSVFPNTDVILYGEGYGAGIQKGGDYSDTKKFILFDVLVDGKWWLDWSNTVDVAAKLGLDTVPYIGEMTLEDATSIVREGFNSCLNGGKAKAEGLVGRPVEALFDKKGHRLIIKLKTKDF
jgi:hypothetical protein